MTDTLPDTLTPSGTPLSQLSEVKRPWGRLISCLVFLDNVDLFKPEIKLGRLETCDIIIHKSKFYTNLSLNISKEHFVLYRESDGLVYLTDLSKNGTFINSRLIGKNQRNILQNNDLISIGQKSTKVYVFQTMQSDLEDYLPLELRKKYEPSNIIGKGAVGEVRLIYEKTTCKKYAVKKIVKSKCTNSNMHQLNHPSKIQTEVNILKALSHPCIIRMKEIIDSGEEVFIVLEYMNGGDLTNRIHSVQSMTEANVKFLFYQMVIAVQYLHFQGITHRDLKPDNVLLASDDTETLVKVSDFGLSKITDDDILMQTICGTLYYIAPEVLDTNHTEYNRQVDIWSLGVILYYMFSKELPFKANERDVLGKLILTGTFQMDSPVWKRVSVQAKGLIREMLTVDPQRRINIDGILQHPWIDKDIPMQYKVDHLLEKNLKINNKGSDCYFPPAKKLCIDSGETSI